MCGRFVRGCFMPVEGIPRYPVNIRFRQPQNRSGRCAKAREHVKLTRESRRLGCPARGLLTVLEYKTKPFHGFW